MAVDDTGTVQPGEDLWWSSGWRDVANRRSPTAHRCLASIVEGEGEFAGTRVGSGHLALFEGRGAVAVTAGARGCRYLLLSGRPLGEPVAWYGPIVMNTEEELETAFREYRDGTFVKVGAPKW